MRTRVSTTVDDDLLHQARALRSGVNDATLLDEALAALVESHKRTIIDAAYEAYRSHPWDEADEWGDLVSWSEGVKRS